MSDFKVTIGKLSNKLGATTLAMGIASALKEKFPGRYQIDITFDHLNEVDVLHIDRLTSSDKGI